jgi:hypothetical protein
METSRPLDSRMQTSRSSPSQRTPLTSVAFDGGPCGIPLRTMISLDMVSGSKKRRESSVRLVGEGARFLTVETGGHHAWVRSLIWQDSSTLLSGGEDKVVKVRDFRRDLR